MTIRTMLIVTGVLAICFSRTVFAQHRPNILFVIADDWSYGHAGVYGDPVVRTPNIDSLARGGALFLNAFSAAPSCTPSRAAVLTGRYPHALEAGASLWGSLPEKYDNYVSILEKAGYHTGLTGKGWGPGNFRAGGYAHNPAGKSYPDFATFLKEKPDDKPFVFWFGSVNPHRPYVPGSGAASGMDPGSVRVPGWLPDTPEVRNDILDYYGEVEAFDAQLGDLLKTLHDQGGLSNTLIIVTGDNGMPFPRAKATLYDGGTKVPLIMRFPGRIGAGTRVEALVSLVDLAPTMLEASALKVPEGMHGKSLWPLLTAEEQDDRDVVFIERERHANVRKGEAGYPSRGVRSAEYLYIRNYAPERWPAGDPELYHSVGPYGDVDGSPSKTYLLDHRDDPRTAPFFRQAFGKHPAEELYDLRIDPDQLNNVAADSQYRRDLARMRKILSGWQKSTGDPRAGDSHYVAFDRYPYYGPPAEGAPSRYRPPREE